MYTLQLADGSTIINLKRVNPSTFELKSDETSPIYFQLSDQNLSFATLYKDGELEDVLFDYTRQNFIWQNGVISFRLAEKEALDQAAFHKKDKEQIKRRERYRQLAAEERLKKEEKGWD